MWANRVRETGTQLHRKPEIEGATTDPQGLGEGGVPPAGVVGLREFGVGIRQGEGGDTGKIEGWRRTAGAQPGGEKRGSGNGKRTLSAKGEKRGGGCSLLHRNRKTDAGRGRERSYEIGVTQKKMREVTK